MGWLSHATGWVILLTISAPANAGARIAYPSANQMYALLGSDVVVTFGTVQPKAPVDPAPATDPGDRMPLLLPAHRSFPDAVGFVPSVRDYGMLTPNAAAPPELEARINDFWNLRQDVFPEQQRVRLHSLTDSMLTLSIGGSSGPGATLSIDGGVAGVLWSMSRQ